MDENQRLIYRWAEDSTFPGQVDVITVTDPSYQARLRALANLTIGEQRNFGFYVPCEPPSFLSVAKMLDSGRILVTFNLRSCGAVSEGGFQINPMDENYKAAVNLLDGITRGQEKVLSEDEFTSLQKHH